MPLRRITLEALHRAHANLVREPELNKQMASVYLAIGVLNEFLGEQWVAKYIFPGEKPDVLALDETDQLSSAMSRRGSF